MAVLPKGADVGICVNEIGPASLCRALSWTDCLGVSPCVARYLPPMAPGMAP